MNLNDKLREKISDVKFCYAKDGGSGFVDKDECVCDSLYKCQAYRDRERFHQRFNEEGGDLSNREEIIQKLKPEFKGSQWWKENVFE